MQPIGIAPGVKAGYNWQFGQLVVGVGGDYNVNLELLPKGTVNVGIGTTSPQATLDVNG